ncbi:phosphoethanolamine transferase [Pseudoalteromonas xiamenensis]|uniref:Phosphoethanolamine--lipid A transferase n=1 Tax=Pseudoalteromonas xiamenensis TaxID=882626 RepID=A0A975DLW6_9GAMM|nr:phosphoethanolamine--lipid A transferase [Pseudoalteromonas xiamenensis]QTH73627.1 phosphoethanolamine--lipid A transferase [Pseudoalteromonas xiamenensis]
MNTGVENLTNTSTKSAVEYAQALFSNRYVIRFIVAMWITLTCNTVFYENLNENVLVSAGLLLFALNWLIISIFSVGRLFKPGLILLICISASVEYFSTRFGIMMDYGMLQNVLETDVKEAADLINFRLFFHFLVYAALPSALVLFVPTPKSTIKRRVLTYTGNFLLVLGLLGTLAFMHYQTLSGYFRMNKEQRYYATPLNAISAIKSHVKMKLKPKATTFTQIASSVAFVPFSEKPTVFVLVLGETVRADHFGLNGYERNTTPNLSKLPVYNFKDVSSCGTATAHSVPCMFSWMNKADYDEFTAKNSENVIDIVKRAGFDVIWRDNNSGCKGVCSRVKTEKLYEVVTCEDGCPDELLLEGLPKLLEQKKNTLIVLHQQGSHGPAYFRRSQQKHKTFLPECEDETFATCSQQEIINAYDNSLVETDAMLSSVIELLDKQKDVNTGLLYVSDHGESLGENGVYLHGLPYAFAPSSQTHIPMLFWLSDNYQKDVKLDRTCLNEITAKPTSHDALFGSLLGLLSIDIKTEKQTTDLVTGCRG